MMADLGKLGALQLDALREVANIGAGHAATALSELTKRRISIDVPKVRIALLEEVPHLVGPGDELVATLVMQILGDLNGRTIQVFPRTTAARLIRILLGSPSIDFPDGFGEMELSALKEAGNILASAYLSALSEFLGMRLSTSIPSLALDKAAAALIAGAIELAGGSDHVICLDTTLRMDGSEEPVAGHFLLVPDSRSLSQILEAIRVV